MNIESLKYFITIAEVKSISKVSNQSHISQSALSQLIHKLEESIGYDLFIRSNKGVKLTKMGEVVYDYANMILKTYDKMIEELSCIEQNQCNVIINSTWAISNYSLPCLIVEMKKKLPNIHYELRSNRSEDIIKNVENGLADIGVIYCDPGSKILEAIHFSDEPIVLVANKNFKIPNQINVKDLINYHIIEFRNGCYYTNVRNSISNYMKNHNSEPIDFHPLLNLDSISAVKSSVLEGLGISFLPYSSVKKELLEDKLRIIEIEDIALKLKVNIISQKHDKLDPVIKRVLDLILKIGPNALC